MILETLKKSSIFHILNDEQMLDISHLFQARSFKKNEYIFMQGDPSHFLFLAAQGQVKMLMHTEKGKDVILEIKSPGELFCCSAVLDERPFPESAQAMQDVSVIQIQRAHLLKILERYPELNNEIARYSGRKLKEAHEMLKNMATEKVEGRIASLLLKLTESGNADDTVYVKTGVALRRQEIANMVGTTVETCIRTIRKFEKDGLVASDSGNLLVNRSALKGYLERM